jgi:hypothetical protein
LTPYLDAIALSVRQLWKPLAKCRGVLRENVGLPPGIDLCRRAGGPSLLDARQASTFGVQRLRSLKLFLTSSCVLRSKIVCDGACFKRAGYIAQ